MAKQLLLIRHGKSDWGNNYLADFDRPLNSRGLRNAPEMALRLSNKNLIPELIVSSPALRALTTARNFAQVWNKSSGQIKEELAIYEANTSTLLSIVNKLDDAFNRVALFGHNPGFTEFANYLSGSNIHNIPTCGVVLIEFPFEEWKLASMHTGTVEYIDYPKSIDEH